MMRDSDKAGIISDIRRSTKRPAKLINCYLCEKHPSITQCHHLYPISEIADDIELTGKSWLLTTWLCPNCHAYIHALERKRNTKQDRIRIFEEMGSELCKRYLQMMEETNKRMAKHRGIDLDEMDK